MKRLLLLPLLIFCFSMANAQGVSINTTGANPDSSAILDVSSTTQGLLPPRMTEAERDLINNPATGLIIYNTTTDCINMWNGNTWRQSCFDCDFSAPNVTNNGPICEGITLNLTADPIAGATYSWTGPNGFSSNLQNPSISNTTAAASGIYSLEVTLNGCTSSPITTSATVNPVPSPPTAGNNGSICEGSPLNLSASTIAGVTYSWNGPNGFSSSLQNPQVNASATIAMSGDYSVSAELNGCVSDFDTTTVNVFINPTAGTASAANSSICSGQTASLSLAGSSGSIQWQESTNNVSFSNVTGGSGATTANYTTPTLTSTMYYRAMLITGICTTFSNTVTISVSGSVPGTGGTISTSGPWTIHTFTSNGTFNPGPCATQVEYLIVAGGGGGGDGNAGGGAGGAGGFVEGVVSVTNQNYSIVVGSGGAGSNCTDCFGNPGQNSSFAGITAVGGGRGGGYQSRPGGNGGSGGGASGPSGSGANSGGSSNQTSPAGGTGYGNSGAAYTSGSGGGGGGAGGAATNWDGGPGRVSTITGSSVYYAGGGGGGDYQGPVGQGGIGGGGDGGTYPGSPRDGANGLPNTGGGGGGAADGLGGDGGSGIVIIRYQ